MLDPGSQRLQTFYALGWKVPVVASVVAVETRLPLSVQSGSNSDIAPDIRNKHEPQYEIITVILECFYSQKPKADRLYLLARVQN